MIRRLEFRDGDVLITEDEVRLVLGRAQFTWALEARPSGLVEIVQKEGTFTVKSVSGAPLADNREFTLRLTLEVPIRRFQNGNWEKVASA